MSRDCSVSVWSQRRSWSGDVDDACQRFEQAWLTGEEPVIDMFVDAATQERSDLPVRELLIELVGIDLEWRWRREARAKQPAEAIVMAATIDRDPSDGRNSQETPARPLLEHYVGRYSALGSLEALPIELIGHEYWVRHRWGDRPDHDEYGQRFVRQWSELQTVLDQIRQEFSPEDSIRETRAPDTRRDGSSDLRIRCPHCHSPMSLDHDAELSNITCSSCGERFNLERDEADAQDEDREPQRIAHFELVEQLGAGAFGVVWKAKDTQLDRIVAVKIPRHSKLDSGETEQFLREARAAAQLRHPNIVSVHEVGREGDRVYIVSDFIEGQPLDHWLKQNRPTHREAAQLCQTVAQALDCAHEHGVIHRDLKPANIMMDDQAQPYIMDFGLAKREAAEVTMTQEGQILGTPAYMSPEQAKGEGHTVDARTDIYSLGAILFELLTRALPFRAKTIRMLLKQVIEDQPPSPRKRDRSISRDLETICLKCLEKDPRSRYPSSQALADDLDCHLKGKPIKARPIGHLQRAWRWCKRQPVVAAMSLAMLLLVVVGAIVGYEIRTQGRAVALVERLLDAETTEVPHIVDEMAAYRSRVLPLLRQAEADAVAKGDVQKRLHVSLALLPVDPNERDHLYEQMLSAEPDQFFAVCQALADHREVLVPRLWSVVRNPQDDDSRRFRAASALAEYSSEDPRWEGISSQVVEHLVSIGKSEIGGWTEALRPVRLRLLSSLESIFRDGTRVELERSLATAVLQDYAKDRPEVLVDLIATADQKQFAALFPLLEKHRDKAAEYLQKEVERTAAPDWNDPPLDSSWKDVDPSIVRKIEAAHGVWAERFAFCQTMPLNEFLAVAEGLRESGYRPTRYRPYASGEIERAAAVWTRDGRDWAQVHGVSCDEIRTKNDELEGRGFQAVDVTGYSVVRGDSRAVQYAALWVARENDSESRILVGTSIEDIGTSGKEFVEMGLGRSSYSACVGADDEARFSAVWTKPTAKWECSHFFCCAAWEYSQRSSQLGLDHVQFDVHINTNRNYCGMSGVWHRVAGLVSTEAHGLDPEEHLTRCREFVGECYRPATVSVAEIDEAGALMGASVWHRPAVPEAMKDALAGRQANAAVASLRLGSKTPVWPMLHHKPDPTTRSYLVHRLASLGADPEDLVRRLYTEPDVSVRRALILSLGEFDMNRLSPAARQRLLAQLLGWYRDDPDPGIHGAAEWLLERWGLNERGNEIIKELAPAEVKDGRQWYVNGQGQTMIVVSGPVTLQMGSPATEEGRSHVETLHTEQIDHSFAIASKQVTVEQFRRFDPSYGHNEMRRCPQLDCPILGVLWYEAAAYCNWLNDQEGIPESQWCYEPNEDGEYAEGMKIRANYLELTGYRLPIEAEWEYACRASAVTSRYFGHAEQLLPEYAWYSGNSQERTWPVGTLKPNDLGMFDMLGNACDWCQDCYSIYRSSLGRQAERAQGIEDGANRLIRGGGYNGHAVDLRSANRSGNGPDRRGVVQGFRLAKTYLGEPRQHGQAAKRHQQSGSEMTKPSMQDIAGGQWILLSWAPRRTAQADLWLFSPDGQTRHNITNSPTVWETAPQFSPDGRRIVFLRHATSWQRRAVWICNVDGTNLRQVAACEDRHAYCISAVWVSDDRIWYVRDPIYDQSPDAEIWEVNVNDGEPQFLFRTKDRLKQGFAVISDASPDGERLVADMQEGAWAPDTNIYAIDCAGTSATITPVWVDSNHIDGRALLSPDGKRIAWMHVFTPGAYGRPEYDGVGIAVQDDNNRWIPKLQENENTFVQPIAWSPDGSHVLCGELKQNARGVGARFFLINDQLEAVRTVVELDSWYFPTGVAVSRMGDWTTVPNDIGPDAPESLQREPGNGSDAERTTTAEPTFIVGADVNLGSGINGPDSENAPSLSQDALSLYFYSDRPGGLGESDLFVATRESPSKAFGEPRNLGDAVNTAFNDAMPSISEDELTLLFASDRPGGAGDLDLWMATRKSKSDAFANPRNLGSAVNSPRTEMQPCLSADGLSLFFHTEHTGRPQPGKLWVATRESPSEPFRKRALVAGSVNSEHNDKAPCISADGLTLIFASSRPGGIGIRRPDLWMASRDSIADPFGEPIHLGPLVNSSAIETSPSISFDKSTLFFASDRPGGLGSWDIWKVPLRLSGLPETQSDPKESDGGNGR